MEENKLPSFQEFVLVNWEEEGKKKAANHGGSKSGLIACLGIITNNHIEILRKDTVEQENAKKPYIVKLQEYISVNESLSIKIERMRTEAIPNEKAKISKLQEDIINIKRHPENYAPDNASKLGFIIGGVILIFLTIYLGVFYSSASYSAFFKEFKLTDLGVVSSIFDAQAFSKALKDGATELILIITIPFVFIGLGYLIHKFQEQTGFSKFLKIGMLLILTFIFDSILAYEITEKIYNLKANNSFETLDPYTVGLAFTKINFWLIIFAGFVVYVVWGFVFDFFMEAYAKLDKLNSLIESNKLEIKNIEAVIKKCDEDIIRLNKKFLANRVEIEKLQTILDHANIIKPKELQHSIMQFFDGWLQWLKLMNVPELDREDAQEVVKALIAKNITSIIIENPQS